MDELLQGFPVDIKSRVTSTENGFQILSGSEKLKVRPARMMTCDAIADLLEWGRLRMPGLVTDVDGPLVHLVGYYVWTVDSIPADEEYARHREAAVRGIWDMQIDLREACARETAPRVEVAGLKYPLLWQPAYSPSMRSLEQELAAGFRPGGMEREEAGRALLSEFMLISTRLVSIGWSRIRAAATAATAGDDDEEAGRMGTTFGMVLTQARDRAEQRMAALRQARDEAGQSTGGQAASTPGWEKTALETMVVVSGALHVQPTPVEMPRQVGLGWEGQGLRDASLDDKRHLA